MTKPVAIVLGAAVWAGGVASPTLRRRAETAAALYHAGKVGGIVATGGEGAHRPTEAEAVRDILTGLGVPENVIALETRSRNTLENIAFSRDLLPEGAKVVLVSDAWHLPRARLVARRLGLEASGACPPLRGTRALVTVRAALREVAALLAYLLHLRR
ncbi:YdcF family protein [Sinisalibacter lacisalsi]|uniref:DUF218 domain-containing protein n=1 Tax=Sinisalibacter lacisalsi TaxID=1526570 RepID=A0ABQ1QFS7_9RHOB|nr:YdcF family protein [Sinisalibacter lacisalsi]GGD25986.1 hypothetical protein GCM10011358_08040 [Sinisalibacter lacisalsi]